MLLWRRESRCIRQNKRKVDSDEAAFVLYAANVGSEIESYEGLCTGI